MALIQCPECNKEVSDKATVCIHCGYPLNSNTSNNYDFNDILIKLEEQYALLQEILLYQKDELMCYNSICNIFEDVKKTTTTEEQNDNLLFLLSKYIFPCREHLSWKTVKRYFEMIDFTRLSSNGYEVCVNTLISELDLIGIDIGYIIYWYILYQLLKNVPIDLSDKIKQKLSGNSALGGTQLEQMYNFANQHLNDDVSVKSINNNYIHQSNTRTPIVPKCPTCGSTNVNKISGAKKAAGFLTVGVFSSNLGKTMECKNCGYKW